MKNPFKTSGQDLIHAALAGFETLAGTLRQGVQLLDQEQAQLSTEIETAKQEFEEFQRGKAEEIVSVRLSKSKAETALRGLDKLLNG